MADEKQVNIIIKSKYEGQGDVNAKKGLEKVEKQAQKTNDAMIKGADNTAQKIMTLSSAINIAKAAWAGVRGVVGWIAESIDMANKNARSVNMLAAAYNAVGYNAKGALDQAKAFASEMQNLTGIADEVFLDGQRLLANYGIVGQKAQESIRAAYALSVGIGTSMESALTLVAKAAAGSTSSLSRYGIVLADNVKEGEKFDAVLKQINDKFGATAQASMGDMTAQVGALKESWGDLREELGNYLIPAFSKLVEWGQKAVGVLDNLFGNKRSVDQIAYQKNLEKIAETNKQIEYWRSKAYNKAYNQDIVNDHLNRLEKELKFYHQAQEALDKQNYERAKQAKIDAEIRDQQAEQINNAKTLKQQAEEQKNAQKSVSDELKRQQEILDNMGLSSSKDLKGWNRDAQASEQGPTDMEVFAGGQNELGTAADAVAQYDAEAERLEELRNLKLEYIENEITDEQLRQEALTNLEQQYNQQKLNNDKNQAKARQQVYASMWGALTSLASNENKKIAAAGKIAGVAQATISTFTGAAKALELPFPANLAAMATVLAQGFALVGQIQSIKLADGGLVKAVTGGVPAIIGEGGSDEAVLPLNDSTAMRRIGGAIAEESGSVGGVVLTQNITIQAGESLIPDITNALRNATVDALEMANLTVKVGNEQQGLSV